MNILLHPARRITQLGWRLTSLAQLQRRPHAFFERLYALPWYAETMRHWLRWLQVPTASRILELGCSSGRLAAELAAHGHSVVGVDRSAHAIRAARRRQLHAHLHYLTADALHLPFAHPQFDYSLAASLLNVVADPGALLSEMRRVSVAASVVSCLFPTPAMQPDSAREFIHAQALHGFSADALLLWAQLANKLASADVVEAFRCAGLIEIQHTTFLQGMVTGVRGKVISPLTQ